MIDYSQTSVLEALMEMSGGIGPDAVIDAVGMESHGFAPDNLLDYAKQTVGVGADRAHALREAIVAVRKGGRVSIPGVYGGMSDKFPTGALMEKGLQIRTGQTHVQRYTGNLLAKIEDGGLDTTFLISHRMPLEEAPTGYANFHSNQNEWTKVVLKTDRGIGMSKGLAVVTRASTGIGFELARCCADDGYELIVCADEPAIERAAADLGRGGAGVMPVNADLGTESGVDELFAAVGERGIDLLLANAGTGLGDASLEPGLGRGASCRSQRHRHAGAAAQGRPAHAGARQWPNPDHWFDRRLHARH